MARVAKPLQVSQHTKDTVDRLAPYTTVEVRHGDVLIDCPMFYVTFAHRDSAIMTAEDFFANTSICGALLPKQKRAVHIEFAIMALELGFRAALNYDKSRLRLQSYVTSIRYATNAGMACNYGPGLVANGQVKLDGKPVDVLIEAKTRDEVRDDQ